MHPTVRALALLLLLALAGCAGTGIQPCNDSPRASLGPCAVGAHHDNGV